MPSGIAKVLKNCEMWLKKKLKLKLFFREFQQTMSGHFGYTPL